MKKIEEIISEIKEAIKNTNYEYYGIRVDSGIKYNIGDTAGNSHELFQDPQYTDDTFSELLYPYIESGRYKGFYDAGELDGTSAIEFHFELDEPDDPNNLKSLKTAIQEVSMYFGKYIHIIAGNDCKSGNDIGEIIIRDAIVLAAFENDL